jgi:acyl-CoA synthetase (AMP-forming)/AMP-acid ligase II
MMTPSNNDETVWKRWCQNAEAYPDRDAVIHWKAGEKPLRWSFSGLVEAAKVLAVGLTERSIRKGDVCAIILRHNPHLYPLYMAICSIGAIPAILAYPNPRLHPDKFRLGIAGMSQRSGLDWIFTERDLQPMIEPLVTHEHSTIRGLQYPLEWEPTPGSKEMLEALDQRRREATASDPFLLQHSSGTTGLQKPVLLSNRAVLEHVECYSRAIRLDHNDKIVSWLPLYHDMGLIAAFHLPLAFGIPTVQIDPFEWVMVPSLLLEAITTERGTVAWLPNFAYNVMADKITDEELSGVDLSSWRLAVNCSEPVRFESHSKILRRFGPYGLRASTLTCCYAMAETTFAVTQTPPGSEPKQLSLDRNELARGKVVLAPNGAAARICVASGKPIDGCTVRIVDGDRADLGDYAVGEIAISSVSLFEGYRNYPEKTADAMGDGWFFSGDYGFTADGDLFVIGRKKDIIIVAGNNVYPEDVEDAVGKVDGVIPGRVVAFAEENPSLGSERVAVIAETNIPAGPEQKKLRLQIIKAGMAIDVTIASVYLVPPRWLIKSSAGKPSRKANRERIVAERQAMELESR